MSSLNFNAVLLEISDQLTAEQLDKLKFLCRNMVGKRELERISSGVTLFQGLIERGKLGEEDTETLSELLRRVSRPDLVDKLVHRQAGWTEHLPAEAEKAQLDDATDVIAESLGRNWRKLGRKLDLNDVKLDSISRKHPTDLEETARELLKEWRKSRGGEASSSELTAALRACQLTLTAERVEERLAGP